MRLLIVVLRVFDNAIALKHRARTLNQYLKADYAIRHEEKATVEALMTEVAPCILERLLYLQRQGYIVQDGWTWQQIRVTEKGRDAA